jgi:hypothetical protein
MLLNPTAEAFFDSVLIIKKKNCKNDTIPYKYNLFHVTYLLYVRVNLESENSDQDLIKIEYF